MNDKQASPEETLTEIRHLMERSSRFISLSGFSGVFAGIYALLGVLAAVYYLRMYNTAASGEYKLQLDGEGPLLFLLADAALVFILAVATGIFLTTRKARKDGSSLFDAAAKKLILNLCIPLVTGGLFCFGLIYHGHTFYVAPAMLIFYGLSLVQASKYTRTDVRSLGIIEILLGLLSLFIGYGIVFWAIGFGLMHIAYGIYMYYKYEN